MRGGCVAEQRIDLVHVKHRAIQFDMMRQIKIRMDLKLVLRIVVIALLRIQMRLQISIAGGQFPFVGDPPFAR